MERDLSFVKRLVGLAMLTFILSMGVLSAQTFVYEFGGLSYVFPTSHVAGQLKNNGSGTLTWDNDAPTGLIMYSMSGSCPSGWTEYTTGRGRYFVGLPLSGTNQATAGTALSNSENRAVGQHNHTGSTTVVITGTHNHTVNDPQHFHGGNISAGSTVDATGNLNRRVGTQLSDPASTGISINTATTGVAVSSDTLTVDNQGSVVGTNAPYIQLMSCEKL